MSTISVPTTEPSGAPCPPEFSCWRANAGSEARVTVAGELDIAMVPRLDHALRRAAADAVLVVLDLRALEFIDSSGAHLLLAADRRIRQAGGRLVVVRGPAEVDWLFALIGIDRRLEVVDEPPAPAGARTIIPDFSQ